MSQLRTILFLGIAIVACNVQANAQESLESLDPFTTTYKVQVRKEHWNNGLISWESVLEIQDEQEAVIMLELLQLALEERVIESILGGSSDFIITDVRMVTETTFDYLLESEPLVLRDYSYLSEKSTLSTSLKTSDRDSTTEKLMLTK